MVEYEGDDVLGDLLLKERPAAPQKIGQKQPTSEAAKRKKAEAVTADVATSNLLESFRNSSESNSQPNILPSDLLPMPQFPSSHGNAIPQNGSVSYSSLSQPVVNLQPVLPSIQPCLPPVSLPNTEHQFLDTVPGDEATNFTSLLSSADNTVNAQPISLQPLSTQVRSAMDAVNEPAPTDRIWELEEENDFLKSKVKFLEERLQSFQSNASQSFPGNFTLDM